MATTKGQRIGIGIILAVTILGTVGSFAVMILAQRDSSRQAAEQQKALAEYQSKYKEYQSKLDEQTNQLSGQYYTGFTQYSDRVAAFDLDGNNKDLKTEDIAIGDGETVGDDSKFAAYYIGWNPSGKVFDQSIDTAKGQLKAPLTVVGGLKNASLIDGWKEGIKGMKLGGVREMTIPSDKAYGEKGSGSDIAPNTPLRFIVMAIPLPATIEAPQYPLSLLGNQ